MFSSFSASMNLIVMISLVWSSFWGPTQKTVEASNYQNSNNAISNSLDQSITRNSAIDKPLIRTPLPTRTPVPTSTPSKTFTPTTVPSNDLIFLDSFESGDFSAWSQNASDGGDLSIATSAAIIGLYGAQAKINDNNPKYVTDLSPKSETSYHARFYFNTNSIAIAKNDDLIIFSADTNAGNPIIRVELTYTNTNGYRLRISTLDNAGRWVYSGLYKITNTNHFIELSWSAATSRRTKNGNLIFWIDGVQSTRINGLDNDSRRVDQIRLGIVQGNDSSTRGTYYFDAFESRRFTYIGPAVKLPTPTPTETYTFTPTPPETPSDTPIPTSTLNDTPTNTPTLTPTPSETAAPTYTPTDTPTYNPTSSDTPTPTDALTSTPSETSTSTYTSTDTPTFTQASSDTPTPTESPTDTPTSSNTPESTVTSTHTPTVTLTPSETAAPTYTPTGTPTLTSTPSETPTPTYIPTPSDTPTLTYTPTATFAQTPTSTSTPTDTPTFTPTFTLTPTATPTNTQTPTSTPVPTTLCGTISQNTILTSANNTYIVTCPLTVNNGVTLTIQAGAVLKFMDAYSASGLTVNGSLVVQGTSGNPVVFTSIKDDAYGGDTNNDGSATTPAAKDWGRIHITSTGNASLNYAIVRYGGCNNCGSASAYEYDKSGIWNEGGPLTITNSTIAYNNVYGIYMSTCLATIHDSNIVGHLSYGIYNSGCTIDARNNWWGSSSGPRPYGSGNGISYQSHYDTTCKCTVIDKYYVNVTPWIGGGLTNGQSAAWTAKVAEPVDTATGNYSYERTDLSTPTRSLPLAFSRSYNSSTPTNGPLGYGWTFSYNAFITESTLDNSATITYGDGRTVRFDWNGTSYTTPAGTFSTLVKSGGLFALTEKDQTVYHFNASDQLAAITDKNGNVTALNYTGTILNSVTAPDGRSLSFTYDGSNRITQVTDPISRTLGFVYNGSGDLTSFTDVLGKVTNYTYDANHRLLTITDANSHTFVTNTYNSDGRVSQQLDASSNLTTFVYDIVAHNTMVTDARSKTTTYGYDASLRLIKVTDPLGYFESYTWDAANDKTSFTDKRGNTTNYTYDGRGNVLTITDPASGVTTNTYDPNNNLLTQTDALGRVTTYTYNANNNVATKTDALSGVTSYFYYADANRNGLLYTQTDPLSRVTTYDYNSHGDLTTLTDALSNITTHTYDNAGRLLIYTDPLNHTTTYTYDNANHVLTVTDPAGGITTNIYDNVGNLLTTTDPINHTTTRTYTVKDQLYTVTDPAGYVTTYAYDTVSNRTSVVDGNNHTTTYAYDGDNRLTGTTNALGKITTFGYDGNGNRTSVTDANSHTTSYTFDKLNRQTVTTDALSHATITTYDAVGNVLSVTDANNHATTYVYDNLNRLTTVTDALSGMVSYTYDAVGNRLSMTDANNHATSYTYDTLNHLLTETDPLTHAWTYTYDAAGRRVTKLDADGIATTYSYDAADRLTGISAPSVSITYVYDLAGNRTSMLDGTGTTTYIYDADNRPLSIAQPNGTITYTYDAVNRLTLTLPGSLITTYAYDAADHLTSVTDWASRVTSYTYDNAGRLITTTYPNGVVTTNTYDNADRLTGIATMKSVTSILSITYTLDNVGNRLTMLDGGGTTAYTYDALNRLATVAYPSGSPASVSYTYDAMGNRLTMVQDSVTTNYSYDNADRLTGTTGGSVLSFTWDNNGQMLTKGSQTLSWDTLGHMTTLTNGGTSASYVYNGDGVRTAKTVNSSITNYLQDLASGLPVVMAETTGASTTQYVYGSDLIAQVNGSTPSFYHADGLGSTRAMTNSTGTSTDQYTYDAFGATRSHSGSSTNSYTYTGQQNDPEASLVFLRARYYDSTAATFISRDSFSGYPSNFASQNRYLYATDNPVNMTDPGGQDACAVFSCDAWYQFGRWSGKNDTAIRAAAAVVGFMPVAGGLVKNDILAATGKMSTSELAVSQVAELPGAVLDVVTFGGSQVLNLSKGATTVLGAADLLAIPGKEATLYLTGDQSWQESALNAGTGLLAKVIGDEMGNYLFPRGPGATPSRNWFGPVGRSIMAKYLTAKLFDFGGEKLSDAINGYLQMRQNNNPLYGASSGGDGVSWELPPSRAK